MIYRTTEQFFPSSYIKKRRKIQSDQRQNLAILRPLFLPKKNRFRNTTYCYVSGQHQPNSSPFLAKDLAAKKLEIEIDKMWFPMRLRGCYVFEVGHVTRGYTRNVQVALLRAVAVFGLLRHLSARGGPKGAARRIDEWLIGGNASTTNRRRSAPPLDPLPPVRRKFGTSCVWIVEDDASVGKLNRFFRLSRDITDTTGATLAP